jgi:hypothetical protein
MPDHLRLALDQNFPKPLLKDLRPWLPKEVELTHVGDIDKRLSSKSDRELIIALHQLGFDGLVTNNWRMLNIDSEIAAIVATNAVIVAMRKMGDDAIRPAGALLLELAGLPGRVEEGRSNVFDLHYPHRPSKHGWTYLADAAVRSKRKPNELWKQHKPSESELNTPVLD